MCSQVIAWLSGRVQEFGYLPENEKKAIQDFSLLWSYFEGTKLNYHADGKKKPTAIELIKNYVKSSEQDGSLDRLNIDEYLKYLRDRYFTNGDQFYKGLNLKESKQKEYVDKILQGNNISKEDELIGCLVIIYCLRNNLFHGDKWRYQLQEQYSNFTRANDFLMSLFKPEINGA